MSADTGGRPTVFLLHGLGLSGRLFGPVVDLLGEDFDAVPVDLPGFGDEAGATALGVSDLADAVARVIAERAGPRWLLVGHSMGGKVATIVASRTLSGEAPLFGLAGVVLLAASPPSPEPMADEQRRLLRSWAADDRLDADAARAFVDANVAAPLDPALDRVAIGDVRRASPDAWLAWVDRGSLEDWSEAVGTLDVPALILCGGEDPALGEAAQRELQAPIYPRAECVVLPGARHLLPLERPAEIATAITEFWRTRAGLGPTLPADFAATLASSRVSARTRSALAGRILADDPSYSPVALTPAQLETLRAMADRVVPQSATDGRIDLAARVDARLGRGEGDGWRFADLPTDLEAYRAALDGLAGLAELGPADLDERLAAVADGDFAPPSGGLSAAQLAHWFADAGADLVSQWVAHPATMARIGYDGIANGGDGPRKQGFQLVGADQREGWEPLPEVGR